MKGGFLNTTITTETNNGLTALFSDKSRSLLGLKSESMFNMTSRRTAKKLDVVPKLQKGRKLQTKYKALKRNGKTFPGVSEEKNERPDTVVIDKETQAGHIGDVASHLVDIVDVVQEFVKCDAYVPQNVVENENKKRQGLNLVAQIIFRKESMEKR